MSANTLLLFGDQTGVVLPSIQSLSKLAMGCESLAGFLRRSTDRLHTTIARLPAHQRRGYPKFESPLDLATAVAKEDYPVPALATALLCISQIGHIIVYLESNPRALDGSESNLAILGVCTGLLPAAAVSCCRNLTELLSFAGEIVNLAFQIGLQASSRSNIIDPLAGSWTTLVTNVDIHTVREALEAFNRESVLDSSHKAYISAESTKSVTISAPPSTAQDLFKSVAVFQDCKTISLPISAAFHASHLPPVNMSKVSEGLSKAVLGRRVQHRLLISPASGTAYPGETFGEVLVDILNDILQNPILLDSYTRGLARVLCDKSKIKEVGPVNSTKAIKQAIQALGISLETLEASEVQLEPSGSSGAVAIVGMSVRLPGSETLEEFWKVLEDGRDLHEKIRPDRFDVNTHFDATGKIKNTTLTPYGVFIDRPGYFDTRLFNMSPREAAQTDPQQRLMLLATYEALEMAGYTPNATPSTNTSRIGSFMGQTSDDYREVNASQNVDTYFITGGIRAFGPGRLNYHFGWEGPSYSIDTACSSSAASIQLACSALLARECDMAVGGGANFLTASDLFAGLSRGSFLSKTGGCKTFDHDADGYVRADAVGVVVLKRLSDALADRDNILAVLRGAVTNHSAEAVSITHPHAETQERLFRAAINQAGILPHDIDYAELHGTGTQAGDATESRSVTNVLARGRQSDNPLYIGTVKPNLGHGEAASGVTSLIKAIMMLRKNMIPPHVGIKGRINQKLPPLAELNTHISFGKTPFHPRSSGDGKRRILINNFDAAGGNTSMVIEDPPSLGVEGVDPRTHHVIAISGKTPNAILGNTQRLLEYLRQNPDARLADVAYTMTARRMHHALRRAHVASTTDGLIASLEQAIRDGKSTKSPSTSQQIVFLFTGQGSQYLGMASELFKSNSTFRELLEHNASICVSHGFESFLPLIQDTSFDFDSASPVQMQLAIASIELAIAAWWKSIGVTPTAVVGHSLGEYPALCVAGVLSLSDCLYLVGKRANLMVAKCTPGTHSMLAVQTSEKSAQEYIDEVGVTGCEIACVNAPSSTVVSGPTEQIQVLQEKLQAKSVKTTILAVQFAFHSAQMDPILEEFVAVASKVHFAAPTVPVASTVIGSLITDSGIVDAEYLRKGTRGKVQFLGALQQLKASDQTLWIETGPTPTCLGLVKLSLAPGDHQLLPSLKRKENDWKILANSVASAFNAGIDIDWREFHRPYELAVRLLELPHYAFDLKNYWLQYEGDWAIRKGDVPKTQNVEASNAASLPKFSTTSLHRIESESRTASEVSVTFATDAREPKLNKALRGHLVNGAGLCPSSVYADMAFTAASYITKTSKQMAGLSMDVREMEVHKPLLIQPGDTHQIIRVTAAQKTGADRIEVKFSSQDGSTHQEHAHCIVALGDGDKWKTEWAKTAYLVRSRIDGLIQASARGEAHKILRPMAYKLFTALVDYDTRYQGMREVYMDSNLFEAAANIKFNTTEADGTFTYSPYWIDSIAHLSGFVLNGADTTPADAVYISHGWGSMKIVGELSPEKEYQSYVRMQETSTRGVMAGDVYFFEGNTVVAVCQDLKFQRIKRAILNHLLPPTSLQSQTQRPEIQVTKPTAPVAKPKAKVPVKNTVAFTEDASPQPNFDGILGLIASEVGVEVAELTDDAAFADLGIDSLLSISITAKLSELLGQDVPAGLFHECLTVGDLRQYYLEFGTVDVVSSSEESDDDADIFSRPDSHADTPFTHTGMSSGTPTEDRSEVFKKIIASEVGVTPEEIDDDTPLADLGVDSLLSLSILSAIKAQTGQVLPSSFLMDHPTLASIQTALGFSSKPLQSQQLVQALEKAQNKIKKVHAEAVLLQGSASSRNPALFILPDGSGSASSYVGLPQLNLAGPVYGLNSPFLQNPESFTISLRDVAALYVEEIQHVQPRGPYHLAGWSIGGTYAFEVATQLIRLHGEKVDSLTLIDSPCPKTLPPLPLETVELLGKIGAFDGLKAKRSGGESMREGVRAHFAGSVKALEQYKPGPLASAIKKVTAIWAGHGVWETVGEEVKAKFAGSERNKNAARDWMLDPRPDLGPNGWESLLPNANIKCEAIAGDHFSIMRKPGILKLGASLADAVLGSR
ncbi:hypothetical protein QBC35DRAFT_167960 [Podospora australis]|uniref:Polyketide synthase n=1 Tax=Podospora australis TaxID=1536484 RepID=A0AAN6WVX5_9PEZI|nr:hypothetical protein QBC35DRAFT_167960 [Podospora australis]